MYELAIAAKYLIPRWRQLSVSIISVVSVLVIAVVVWLIVVFFSVTSGLTNSWIDKLIALTAPVRITPTPRYYQSHYYLIDSISSASDYTLKTIGEKQSSSNTDPYDPDYDEEPPANWKQADRNPDGSLKDPVQQAFAAIASVHGVKDLSAIDYEMTVGNLRLKLLRQQSSNHSTSRDQTQNVLSQSAYLGSLDPHNPKLLQTITPPSMADLTNLLSILALSSNSFNDSSEKVQLDNKEAVQARLKDFFQNVSVEQLRTPKENWQLPTALLPNQALWNATLVKVNDHPERIIVSQNKSESSSKFKIENISYEPIKVSINEGVFTAHLADGSETTLQENLPFYLKGENLLSAKLIEDSIDNARSTADLRFKVHFSVHGTPLTGEIRYGSLEINRATLQTTFNEIPKDSPFWMYAVKTPDAQTQLTLPTIEGMGDGILLPKSFRTSGLLLGDPGYLSYYAPTVSSVQEQRIPVFVAGFYDPGIIPIGGKFVLTSKEITTLIRSFYNQEEVTLSNGINVRFDNTDNADLVKEKLQQAFDAAGIASYWKIETYKEYEFTRDIIQQLQSEKRLFTLLATLIIIVACSNIISMLIILVNDKKLEIGILRSMGATSFSIALIFGTCGVVMGAVGSLLGMGAALITLKNLQSLVNFIGHLQGYEMFNPHFYGETLPSEVSFEALAFVLTATATISLIAGVIPAIKASLLKPAAILKAE
ncbi:MAG: ABC transporter permease [Parachlamydiaceae bacterium]|nr:ABC transporter permease [Parachlamydiaceae bacterium]